METEKFTDLIFNIRNEKFLQHRNIYLKVFVYENLNELKENPQQLILLLKEISKKINEKIENLIVDVLIKSNIFFEENIFDALIFYDNKVIANIISEYVDRLSLEFIDKHSCKLNWELISYKKELPEEFMERHADKLHWVVISQHQKLS